MGEGEKRRKGEGRRNRGGEDSSPSSSGSWLQSPGLPWKEQSPRFLFCSPSCERRCTVQSWRPRARRTPCSLQGGGVCSPSPSTDAAVPGSASQAQRCWGAPGRRAVLPSDHWGFLPLSATGFYVPRSSLGPGPGPLNLISIHGFNYQTNTTKSKTTLCHLLDPSCVCREAQLVSHRGCPPPSLTLPPSPAGCQLPAVLTRPHPQLLSSHLVYHRLRVCESLF